MVLYRGILAWSYHLTYFLNNFVFFPADQEPLILPDAVRPTSRYLRRGDTLTADSPHQVLGQ